MSIVAGFFRFLAKGSQMVSAIVATLLSTFYSLAVPWLKANILDQASKLGQLNLLDVVQSGRVAICAGAGAAVVAVFDRIIPDGITTWAAVGVVAAVLDTVYRLRKGE